MIERKPLHKRYIHWDKAKKDEVPLLRYGNRKQDDTFWVIDTEVSEQKAFWALFKYLDEWGMYEDLKDIDIEAKYTEQDYLDGKDRPNARDMDQARLYRAAKKKDYISLQWFLEIRKNGEYEEWHVEYAKRLV